MTTRRDRYRQAAISYFIYGLIYLAGAVYLAQVNVVQRSGWMWFVVGTGFVLALPPLIWFRFKWITRILAVLVGIRVVGLARTVLKSGAETVPLPWGGVLPIRYGALVFLLVAVGTAYMLARAGWNLTYRGNGNRVR